MKLFSLFLAIPAVLSAQQPSDAGFKPITLQAAVTLAQGNSPTAIAARA